MNIRSAAPRRADGVRAANTLNSGFRHPEMLYLALGDQILHGSRDILDGHIRIDAVLIEQIDCVGPQSLQARLPRASLECVRACCRVPSPECRFQIDVETELGGDRLPCRGYGSSASPTNSSFAYGP